MGKSKGFRVTVLSIILIVLLSETILRIFIKDLTCISMNPVLRVSGECFRADFDENRFWKHDKRISDDFIKADFKIIVLSDSVSVMLEGRGYPEILEKVLREKLHKNIKVFNAGIPGYTSYQGLVYLKELLVIQPDLVLVNFGWNDHWCSINGIEDKNQRFSKLFYIKRNVCRISKVFCLLDNLCFKIIQKQYKKRLENINFSICKKRVSLEDYKKNLREIIIICKKRKINVILMTAVYLDNNTDWLDIHIEYNDVVRDIAKEEDVYLLDAVDSFKKGRNLFLEPDNGDYCHINLKGSRILAQDLALLIETIINFNKI